MSDSAFVPPEVLAAALGVVETLNPERELHGILIVVEEGKPPVMVSTIHPEEVPSVLQFCIDHQGNAQAFANGEPIGQRRH